MPLHRINIRALQALVAVYQEQSFSRAAERENTTQSGMSTQVKNLEEQLQTQLLVRERNQIGLTPAGEIVYRDGQRILKALWETEAAVMRMRGEVQGKVKFGMIPSLTRAIFTDLVEGMRADHPNVQVSLTEEYSFSLLRRVLDGELEFAFVPAGDIPNGLTANFAGRDREVLVSRPGALPGLSHLDPAPLTALEGARLVVPTELNVRRRRIGEVLKAQGIGVAEMVELDGMLATLEMVAQSDWVAILPSAICFPDKDGKVRQLNPVSHPDLPLDYAMVERSDQALSDAARLLSDRITRSIRDVLDAF